MQPPPPNGLTDRLGRVVADTRSEIHEVLPPSIFRSPWAKGHCPIELWNNANHRVSLCISNISERLSVLDHNRSTLYVPMASKVSIAPSSSTYMLIADFMTSARKL